MHRMYDIIMKKREGLALDKAEIESFVRGVTDGTIPDYQTAALLMAIFFVGMSDEETACLTLAMARSGSQIDLSDIPGVKVDKHSTGGVGDKTTLITAPIVAACGLPAPKMSGRGLGFTGGTIDKLEAIPGFSTELSPGDFIRQVREIGLAIAGQTGDLAPADKKLYALRDLTATVDSIPLIAASIMSKKLACTADCIVLDVKTGSGAFMKSEERAVKLAKAMVDIGRLAGRRVTAVITDMEAPLGRAVGNTLEVLEAVEVLSGKGPRDITKLALVLSSHMMGLATGKCHDDCMEQCEEALYSGAALSKLAAMVKAQNGDDGYILGKRAFPKAQIITPFTAEREGFVTRMDAQLVGEASMLLGAGRETKEDAIDHMAGIYIDKKIGDRVTVGETVCTLHTSDSSRVLEAVRRLKAGIVIDSVPPKDRPLVHTVIAG